MEGKDCREKFQQPDCQKGRDESRARGQVNGVSGMEIRLHKVARMDST